MCTATEWSWYNENLIEGCTFLYRHNKMATIHIGEYRGCRFSAQFADPTYDQKWVGMRIHYATLSEFKWPDGSPMIPFVGYDGKPYNRALAKIASLDARFKAKSLPKTTQEPLPLPA